jgi:hypothetical protein
MSDRQRAPFPDTPPATRRQLNEAEDALRRIAAKGDPLATWQREIVGQSVRIHIPLRDAVGLKRQAAILRVLASKLELLSGSKEEEWHVLHDAKATIKLADKLMRGKDTL